MTKGSLGFVRLGLIASIVVASGLVFAAALPSAEATARPALPAGIAEGLRYYGIFARAATPADLAGRIPLQAERALEITAAHFVSPAGMAVPYLVVFTDTNQGHISPSGDGPITDLIHEDRLAWLVYGGHFEHTPLGTPHTELFTVDAANFVDALTGEWLFLTRWGTPE